MGMSRETNKRAKHVNRVELCQACCVCCRVHLKLIAKLRQSKEIYAWLS